MAAILQRHGLTSLRRRRRKRLVVPTSTPFAGCVDFKNWFVMGDGRRFYPLTLIDAYSRYLLRCEALLDPDTDHVRRIFDSAFQEFGTPDAIRSDNGPPSPPRVRARSPRSRVWWQKRGIRHDRITPGKPQENGRLERFHRTLAELVATPAEDLRAQQRAFDEFRHEYNDQRPHEALKLRPLLTAYSPSRRRYPRPLAVNDDADASPVRVDRTGHVRWERRRLFVSLALAHETVHVDLPDDDRGRRWPVRWRSIQLGWLDAGRLDRGLILPVRARR